MNRHFFLASFLFSCAALFAVNCRAAAASFAFEQKPDCIVITHGGQPVATYVFRDDKIPRPYFAHLHAPGGIQITRNHPPVTGTDATDHDTLHPGLWLAFGDLNGVDFWRNKGRIEHVRVFREPRVEGGRLSFAVEEKYLAPGGAEVCRGVNEFCFVAGETFQPALPGTLLMWSTTLRRAEGPLTFGPQHEMGLGFRVATPLVVKGGTGSIVSSHGGKNEAGNWGRIGSWWDYSGTMNGRHAGVLVLAAPDNSRPVWSHARDYGFLAINPTGPPPGAKDVPSLPFTVAAGEPLRLKFGVLLHASAEPMDPAKAAPSVNAELKAWRAEGSLSKPTANENAALHSDIVPRLLTDVPRQPTDEQLQADPYLSRFVIIFDRQGDSPAFFRQMWQDHRIACITYHKYPKDAWPEAWFTETEVTMPNG